MALNPDLKAKLQTDEHQDMKPKSKAAWLVALVQRRSHRGWWAYLVWLLAYLFLGMLVANEQASVAQAWPLLIPIVIVIVQWFRPTVLGWAAISLTTFLYLVVAVYYIVVENFGPHPLWGHDSGGVILESLFLVVPLAIGFALIFAARPRALHDSHAA